MPQFLNNWDNLIFPLARLPTIRALPVNSSAPAITTRISPRLNTTPPTSLVKPKPIWMSGGTRVANIAPRPIKKPASIPRSEIFQIFPFALVTPTDSILSAISAGGLQSVVAQLLSSSNAVLNLLDITTGQGSFLFLCQCVILLESFVRVLCQACHEIWLISRPCQH